MKVIINGKEESLLRSHSLADLISSRGINPNTVIIEYNRSVLKREDWAGIMINDGDCVEVLRFLGGGGSDEDLLEIAGEKISSRLFLGTGKFPYSLLPAVIDASGSRVVTVALRRVEWDSAEENILNYIKSGCILMPNTSGARNADEAVRIARIARAAGCGKWIKIEVIRDHKYLLPDNYETVKATEVLVEEGFVVLPYMSPDLMTAKKLLDVGAAAVMPLGSPIGSNRGLQTRELIRIMIEEINLPIIVDAGIGRPSEAAEAMEIGAAAVLVNTAIAMAGNPVSMAEAFKHAVVAGRKAHLSLPGTVSLHGRASSPLTGFLMNS